MLADIIFDSLEPYELSRLQLGARFPKDQIETEEDLRKRLGAGGSDPLKSSLVQQIGERLRGRLDGVKMVNDKPDVLALIDVLTLTVELDARRLRLRAIPKARTWNPPNPLAVPCLQGTWLPALRRHRIAVQKQRSRLHRQPDAGRV